MSEDISKTTNWLLVAAIALVLSTDVAAAATAAQEQDPTAEPATANDGTKNANDGEPAVKQPAVQDLGEVVVTARRRDERLLDVPVPISAISGEELNRYAIDSLTAIGREIPQLVIGQTTNQTGGAMNLRGIGAGLGNPSTEQAVTLNFDGVPVSYGNAIRLGLIDLERVEVLRGPQALFYGKNSPGGIVSLISGNPTDSFQAQVRSGYEFEADQRYIEGIVSGPISESVGGRIAAYYSKEDGYFRNVAVPVPGRTPGPGADSNNAEDFIVRGTLTFESADSDLRMNLKVNHGQRDRDGIGPASVGQPIYCPLGYAQLSGGLTTDCTLDRNFSSVALSPEAAALHPWLGDGIPYVKSRQFLTSLTTDYDISSELTLTSVTGYYKLGEESLDSFTQVTIAASNASTDLEAKAFSQEVRLASYFDSPLNFQLGAFYQDADFTIGQAFVVATGAPFLAAATFYDQHTKAYSVFGQARYAFNEKLELAAGGRMSWEEKTLTGTAMATPFEILNPTNKYKDFSPEVTLTYKPHRDMTAFVSYREGFNSGGYNTVPGALRSPAYPALPARDLSYDQMTAKGWDVGLKGYLGGRQFLFDVVAYNYDYSGLQLSKWDDVAATQTTQNAGGARVRGIELGLTVRPDALPDLQFRSALAYNDARYTDFIGGCYGGQSIAAGCTLNPRNPALDPSTYGTAANPYTTQDQTGQRLTRAPEWTFNSGLTYDFQINDKLGGSVSFDVSYSGNYFTQAEAHPETWQGSFWLLNGAATLFQASDRKWEVALIGQNLTNELAIVTGATMAFTGSGTGTAVTTPADVFGVPNPPRSVVLQLTIRN